MLDAKYIRQNELLVREALLSRNSKFDLDAFLKLDKSYLELQKKIEDLSASQNLIDKELKQIFKDKGNPKEKISQSKEIKIKIEAFREDFRELSVKWTDQSLRIPNIPHSSIPIGDISKNELIKEWGEPKKFDFKPKDHIALAEDLDIIDFKRATKISGSNFALFKGAGATLERALINFMLDLHTQEHGYREVLPPMVVNRASMRGTGQIPNLEDDMYAAKDDDLFLIPTAEVPITNMHRDEILKEEDLPISYSGFSSCFRREAGSYGKDTRGLMRLHQFETVVLVKFVKPDSSYDELDKLLGDACKVLELLEIPYKVLVLATGDISFSAAKCYDIEIYAPGIDKWLEVSSCSNFEDFQARRASIRYKDKESGKNRFVHTLNGSGVALARLVVAILENYQQEDGSVTIPKALQAYMGNKESIRSEVRN